MSVRYETDSVSVMYPALGGLIYRLSAVAKTPVNPDVLRPKPMPCGRIYITNKEAKAKTALTSCFVIISRSWPR